MNWLRQFWNDVKASTDATLLGVLRFFGLLYGPIDRSLRIDEAFRRAMRRRLPPHAGWKHALGGITYLVLILLGVSGVLLAFYYRPSVEEAYASVQHIVSEVPFGWLARDVHVWAASLLIVVLLAHMARVFFDAAYKPPRETNWLTGLLLLGVAIAFGATGYLLPWDQWAYWTVTEVLRGMSAIPIIGGPAARLLIGDLIVSGATLSRYFALHVIILPWLAFGLLVSHFLLVRTHGVAPPKRPVEPSEGVPFYPDHLLRSLMVAVTVVAVVLTLAVLFPRPVAPLADPSVPPGELVSTWVVVDVSLALLRFVGPWGFGLFTLLGLWLAVLPLFDRGPERSLRRRPVIATLGTLFFVGFVVAWFVGRGVRSLPPSVRPAGVEEQNVPPERRQPLEAPGPTPIGPAPMDTGGQGGTP